jgi:hypothetical protein
MNEENQVYQPEINNSQPDTTQPPVAVKHAHRFIFGYISLIILVAAVAGVYAWQHNKVKSLQSEVTAANLKIASTSAASSTSSKQSSSQEYLYLYDYGVKIPLSSGIKDLYFVDYKAASYDALDFSTQSLTNSDQSCLAVPEAGKNYSFNDELGNNQTPVGGSPFGSIIAQTKAAPADQVGSLDQDIGTLIANSNGYYFYYKSPQAPCGASNSAAVTLESTQKDLFTTAFKNIQPIN